MCNKWVVGMLFVMAVHFTLLLQMHHVLSRSMLMSSQNLAQLGRGVHWGSFLDLPEFGTFTMWEADDFRLSRRYKLCLETFLKHNPGRKLVVFSNTMARSEVGDFVEAGYDVVVTRYNLVEIAENLPGHHDRWLKLLQSIPAEWQRNHGSDFVRLSIGYLLGGQYLDMDGIVMSKFPDLSQQLLAGNEVEAPAGKLPFSLRPKDPKLHAKWATANCNTEWFAPDKRTGKCVSIWAGIFQFEKRSKYLRLALRHLLEDYQGDRCWNCMAARPLLLAYLDLDEGSRPRLTSLMQMFGSEGDLAHLKWRVENQDGQRWLSAAKKLRYYSAHLFGSRSAATVYKKGTLMYHLMSENTIFERTQAELTEAINAKVASVVRFRDSGTERGTRDQGVVSGPVILYYMSDVTLGMLPLWKKQYDELGRFERGWWRFPKAAAERLREWDIEVVEIGDVFKEQMPGSNATTRVPQFWQMFPHVLAHCKAKGCGKAVYWSPTKLPLWEHLLRLSTDEVWRSKVTLLQIHKDWSRSDAKPLIDASNVFSSILNVTTLLSPHTRALRALFPERQAHSLSQAWLMPLAEIKTLASAGRAGCIMVAAKAASTDLYESLLRGAERDKNFRVETADWKRVAERGLALECQNVLIPEELAAEGRVVEERWEFFWALQQGLTVISPRLIHLEEIGIFADEHYIELEAGANVSLEQLTDKVGRLSAGVALNAAKVRSTFTLRALVDRLAPIVLASSNEKKSTPWYSI